MVGSDYTGDQGLSTNLDPMKTSGNSINVTTDLKNLPNGLSSINDSGHHVSIYPSYNMTCSEFQDLLNKIEWK